MTMVEVTRVFPPLPELCGRVAVLGGTAIDKTTLLVGLALRQVRQQGILLCLDARRQKQTEVQFRLLLHGSASYLSLPATGMVPDEIAQVVLSTVSRALNEEARTPLLLLDSVLGDQGWERTLIFLLNAGVTVVELLPSPASLVFGGYDTVLVLRASEGTAGEISRAVGRKVSAEELASLKAGEGVLIHLAHTHWVSLPETS
ncbi:MAG TPA: hypothetical protein VGX03_34940 [Candidatus Binatia bacterium]|jgi:hypothetical protein|nr:hypothetical protein [Candidatus Binatia bacterium]